jgi:outer membrane protein assembly factor BamB
MMKSSLHSMNASRPNHPVRGARGFAWWIPVCLASAVCGADWPQYRGANHNGISTDRLNQDWTGSVTNPVWFVALTNCLGSVTVCGGRVFTQTRRNHSGTDMEACVALSATNGVELWATPVDVNSHPFGGVGLDDGPRTTPVVDGDAVFVLTSQLKLLRLSTTNGAVIWQRNLVSLYGGVVIPWENAASPVVENGLIFLNANCGTDTLMALRVTDGSVAWRHHDEAMTHATPTLATIHGVRQVIFATGSGLVSVEPETGALLWRAAYARPYSTSIGVSPVVWGDLVFVCGAHAYGMGSMVVQASFSDATWSTTRLWATNNPASHWMTPVARDGFLYGQFGIQTFDSANAQLKCIDMRTGEVKWSVNGFGRCATLLWDDQLVSLTERGQLVLVQPATNAYTEVARFTAIPNYHDFTNKCWNGPAVCDGRVFIRSTAFVAAFDLSVPALQLDPPRFAAPDALDLAIRTVTGAPVTTNRFANLEVRAAGNPIPPVTQWTKLTNTLVLTGGVVRVPDVAVGTNTARYFIVSEPK